MKMSKLDPEDLFGYKCEGTECEGKLFKVAESGDGTGWYCWGGPEEDPNELAVVMTGSEGGRAKVGRDAKEFLQIALSLSSMFGDVILHLPAKGNECDEKAKVDIEDLKVEDDELEYWKEHWIKHHLSEGSERKERLKDENQCDAALEKLSLSKLSVEDAIAALFNAHLARPRFAIKPDEDAD